MGFQIGLNVPGSAFDAWLNPSNPFADALAPLGKMIGGALDEKMGLGDYWKTSRNYGAENRPDKAGRAVKPKAQVKVDEWGVMSLDDGERESSTSDGESSPALFKDDAAGGQTSEDWLGPYRAEWDKAAAEKSGYASGNDEWTPWSEKFLKDHPDVSPNVPYTTDPDVGPGRTTTTSSRGAASPQPSPVDPFERELADVEARLAAYRSHPYAGDAGPQANAIASSVRSLQVRADGLRKSIAANREKARTDAEKTRVESESESAGLAILDIVDPDHKLSPAQRAAIAKDPSARGQIATIFAQREAAKEKLTPEAIAAAAERAGAITGATAKAGAGAREATKAAQDAVEAKDWRALLGPDSAKLSDAWLAENGHLEYSKMLTTKIAQDKAKAESPKKFFESETQLATDADHLATAALNEWKSLSRLPQVEESAAEESARKDKAAAAYARHERYRTEADAHFQAAKGYLEEAQTGRPPAKTQEESGNPFWDRALFNWRSGKTPTEAPPPSASPPSAPPGPNGMSVSSVTSRAEPVRPPEEAALRESIASEFSALPAPQQTKENLDAIKAAYAIAIPDFGGDKAAAAKWFDEQPINQFGPVGKVLAKRLQAKMKGK